MISIIYNAFKDYKKYFLFILLFSLSFFLIFIFLSIYDYYDYQINYVIGNKEINRGLEVNTLTDSNQKETFQSLNYIENFYPLYNNERFLYQNKYYQVNYKYNTNNMKFGKSSLSSHEIILSYYCFNFLELNEEDVGNKILTVTYDNKAYDFLIVGVVNDNSSQFYITLDEMETIFSLTPNRYYVLINQYLNISKAKSEFDKLGYSSDIYDATGYAEILQIKKLQQTYIYILIFIMIISYTFVNNIIKNIIASEYKNIAILKAVGFKNKKIKQILIIRLISLVSIASLFTTIIEIIIIPLLNKIINAPMFSYNYIVKMTIPVFIILIIVTLICTAQLKTKIKKLSVLEALQVE